MIVSSITFIPGIEWEEKKFQVIISIDDLHDDPPTHQIDCFQNRIGLKIEWNNKDPFYDRDLNNFRFLHEVDA